MVIIIIIIIIVISDILNVGNLSEWPNRGLALDN
jgi:hypothetical protein